MKNDVEAGAEGTAGPGRASSAQLGKEPKTQEATEGIRHATEGIGDGRLQLVYIVKNSLWLHREEHLA